MDIDLLDKIVQAFTYKNFINSIFYIFLVYILQRILKSLIKRSIAKYSISSVRRIESIKQLINYVAYICIFLLVSSSFGVNLNYLFTSAAAFLVVIGLALQETFKNFISGVFLLFEGTVSPGDRLLYKDSIVSVKRVGLRTTLLKSVTGESIIVPNANLLANDITSFSADKTTKFHSLNVSVDYDSDLKKVESVLLDIFTSDSRLVKENKPIIRLTNLGDFSLDYKITFSIKDIKNILNLKSDLNKKIIEEFRKNKITIPFPTSNEIRVK